MNTDQDDVIIERRIPAQLCVLAGGAIAVQFDATYRCGHQYEYTLPPDGTWDLAAFVRLLDWTRLHPCPACDPAWTLERMWQELAPAEDLSRFEKAMPLSVAWAEAARQGVIPTPPEPVKPRYAVRVEDRFFALPNYRALDALRHLRVVTFALWMEPHQYVRVLRRYGEQDRYAALEGAMAATKHLPALAARGWQNAPWPLPEDEPAEGKGA